ncbi:hypothetical protein EB118_02650 [bacterium]|nr:hypothetical protein [Actinomycetota bacterium]NDG28982.1 hypothetical protein [bacterium]
MIKINKMIDTSVLVIILVIAVGSILVYAVERYTKNRPFEWMDASKIGLLSGAGAGGIVYALGGESVTSVVSSVTDSVQDMFVGKPSF